MKSKLVLVLAALVLLAAAASAQKKVRPDKELDFGVKMAKRGLWSEALFRFQQAEKLGDDRAAVYNNIAVAYEALGVFDRAEEYYKKALERDSDNASLRRNYSRFVEFYQSFKPEEGDEGGTTVEEEAEPEASGEQTTGSS